MKSPKTLKIFWVLFQMRNRNGGEMKGLFFVILFLNCIFSNALLPKDEYEVYDTHRKETIRFGDKLSKIFHLYPEVFFKGLKKYTNYGYKEYEYEGIVFSVSANVAVEADAGILGIEILNNRFRTKRGITIGNTKADVLQKYGPEDFNHDNSLYYLNWEGDIMELIFYFDQNGYIKTITLFTGT
jgi:hypothetical protein